MEKKRKVNFKGPYISCYSGTNKPFEITEDAPDPQTNFFLSENTCLLFLDCRISSRVSFKHRHL
jgi:hypothetical protein